MVPSVVDSGGVQSILSLWPAHGRALGESCLGRSFEPLVAVHGAVYDFATPAALCVVMVMW